MGFVGQSKNPTRSYELATNLLRETKIRGTDATGFYSVGKDGFIDFFKTDKAADDFVKKSRAWNKRCPDAICLIGHARATTHGTELKNINNHPHISEDNQLALVHNGIISSHEYIAHQNALDLQGECDSEVLLRLVEAEKDALFGIQKIYTETEYGYSGMACFMSDIRKSDHPIFYAFRNSNPILFIDLREELGQYFFCSTKYIWDEAVKKSGMNKKIKNVETIIVPTHEIWKIDSKTLDIEKINVPTSNGTFNYNYRQDKKTIMSPRSNGKSFSTTFVENDDEYDQEIVNLTNMLQDIQDAASKALNTIASHNCALSGERISLSEIRESLEPILNTLEDIDINLPTYIDVKTKDVEFEDIDVKSLDDEDDTLSPVTGDVSHKTMVDLCSRVGHEMATRPDLDLSVY